MVSFLRKLFVSLCLISASIMASSGAVLDHGTSEARQLDLKDHVLGDAVRDLMGLDNVRTRLASVIMDNMSELEEQGSISLRRKLGDFDAFNALFRNAVINLPDATVSERIALIQLTINIQDLRCTEIGVGDIIITYNRESPQRMTFQVDVVDLDMTCFMEYDYRYIVSGKGNAKAYSDNNQATIIFGFESTNFDQAPPTIVALEQCSSTINLIDLDFDGDWVSGFLDVFERLIRNRVESEVQEVACDEISGLGDSLGDSMLKMVADTIDPFLQPLTAADTDPLAAEKALQVPDDVQLLDFTDTENVIGSWFNDILQEADALLGTEIDDGEGPYGEGDKDLGINVFLRNYVLDEDRALTLNAADLPLESGGVLLERHDTLTETTITLDSVRIFGLDTFTKFEPLLDIGQYTLQNELSWSYLSVEIDVTVDMKASTKPNSIIEGPDGENVVEKIKISLGVDDVDTVISLLLAIDQKALGSLQLGSMLNTSNILSCLLSTVYDVELSGMSVSISNIREPTLDGFVSAGIDRVVTQLVKGMFLMYEQVLLDAVPGMFQTKFRDIVNNELLKKYIAEPENTSCPAVPDMESFIDFRDLLLSPNIAAIAGGTGEEPYGNLGSTLMDLLQQQLLTTGEDGLPSINSMLIGQYTETQSGVEGMIQFPSTLFNVGQDNAMGLQLALSDMRLRNLDILKPPISLLQPSDEPHVLENLINMGPVAGRPLNGTVRLMVGLDNMDPSLSMMNEMDISASVSSTTLSADILAKINADSLMQFPLRDIMNLNCWLAVFPAPELDANGDRVDPTDDTSLALARFIMSLTALSLDVNCISCSSPGVAILPDVLRMLEGLGSISALRGRIEDFAQDIVVGDWLQRTIDQMLSQAPRSCPHHPDYQGTATAVDFPSPGFPSLSQDSVETLIFAGVMATEVAAVVLAESHTNYNANTTDILSSQKAFQVPPGARVLDFTALGDTLGSWFDTALEEVNSYLSDTVDDVGGPNGDTDVGLNVLLRSALLDDRRAFSFKFDGLTLGSGEMQIELGEIRVLGLDTFTSITAMNPVAPQTLENAFGLKHLNVELDVAIKTTSMESSEVLTMSFGVKDIDVVVGLFMAVDQDRLGSLELGSMLSIDRILPCLLSTALEVEMTETSVTVGGIDFLSFEGFLSERADNDIGNLTQAFVDQYGESMVAAIPGIFNVTVRGLINNWVKYYVALDESRACPSPEFEPSVSGFVEFPDLLLSSAKARSLGGTGDSKYGNVLQALYELLNEQILKVDETDDTSGMNEMLIAPLTRGLSGEPGTLAYDGNLLDTGTRLNVGNLEADVEFKVYNAKIEHLDSLGAPLSLLDPVSSDPHVLNNTASFGLGPDPLRMGVTLMIAILADDTQIRNEVDIKLDLRTATVILEALVRIAEDRFLSFPLRDFLNANCWLATLPAPPLDSRGIRLGGAEPSAAIHSLAASIASLDLDISCVECTSPEIEELTILLSSSEGGQAAAEAANRVLSYATKLLDGNFLQTNIDRLLNDAAVRCPHRPEYDPQPVPAVYEPFDSVESSDDTLNFVVTLLIVIGCIVFAAVIVSLVVRWIVRRRNRMWLRSLPGYSVSLIRTRQATAKAKEAEINRMTTSMFRSEDIPIYVRWFIPIVILGNIALFLSGHLSLAASISIEASLAGESFSVNNFFEFSVVNTTSDIWAAGGKPLAILIGLFSGVWPYTKQLITFFLWFAPTRFVSVSKRGSTLLWLDALGKWSMVDIFVLVVSIVAFRVSIESPELAFLPEGFYSVNLLVVPMWGLYSNLTAQLVSQVSSHFIIHYHRRIVGVAATRCDEILGHRSSATARSEDSDASEQSGSQLSSATNQSTPTEDREVLRTHAFERPHRGQLDKLQVRRGVSGVLCFTALAVTVLVVVGSTIASFSVEALGIVGIAVESGQAFQEAIKYYNIFTVANLLMDEARFLGSAGDYIGLGTLCAVLITTVLIVPIFQVIALLRQWFGSLTGKQRARTTVLIEILQAWQYVEVYVFALVVGAWQLGPLSEYLINAYCDGLSETFSTLAFYGILKPEDAQCFKVSAVIENGTYLLITGAFLLILLNSFVMNAVLQEQRDATEWHTPEEDVKLGQSTSEMTPEEYAEVIDSIDPPPVLFTDRFRWAMRREDAVISSRARRGLDDSSKLGVDDGFPEDGTSTLEAKMGSASYSVNFKPTDDDGSDRVMATIPESARLEEGVPFPPE